MTGWCLAACLFALALAGVAEAAGGTVFPGKSWTVAAPESQGIDSDRLAGALAYLEQHSGSDGVHEVAIVRNGRLIWQGDRIDKVHGVWSATKSFTSTILGLLVDDGKCTLDTRAAEHLPELAADYAGVTLRHFATMTSGYRAVGDEPRGRYAHGPSLTPFVPAPDPLFPPGTKYAYWDSAMNEFGLVLTRIAGESMAELFRRRIAEPIGMNPKRWRWGNFGRVGGLLVNGGSGNNNKHIRISAREMARFGHLFLNRGRWNDRQLVSSAWLEQATRAQVPATIELGHASSADGRGVYGFNWWVNAIGADGERKWPGAPPRTFAASGYNNNDMFVIPEWSMVVVRLGLDEREVQIADEIYGEFLRRVGLAIRHDA